MNLLKKLRYVPKRFGVVAAITAAAVIPAALMAWGPDRPTFTIENPASYVTFNSITNNPAHGDERNFVQVKAADAPNSSYAESVNLEAGKEYTVFIYYHNNAATNLNASGKGIAKDAFVRAEIPAVVNGSADMVGYVGASNANPTQVWDEASFTSDSAMALRMVPGSAKISSKGAVNGSTLPDSIITSGAPIGYDALNGTLPGCEEFAGYVTFNVKADQPNFTVKKEVSKNKANNWVENYSATPGETVDYLIQYKNTGTTQQNNVVVKDMLPAGMTYVNGSTIFGNSQTPNGTKATDEVTKGGINIGSYAPGANAWVIFSAKLADNKDLEKCGENKLRNVARVETNNGSKEDDAHVTVPKECLPEAAYRCDGLTVKQISRTQFTFTAERTVQNAEYVRTVFVVRDANGQEVSRINDADGVYTYNRTQTGNYSVEAQIVVRVNGQEKVTLPGDCKKPFEVKKEVVNNVYECVLLEKIEKSRDTYEFKTTARAEGNVVIREVSVDFGDGESQTVDYGLNASHTYATPGTYTAVATVSFTVDGAVQTKTSDTCKVNVVVAEPPVEECKPGIPVGDERCEDTPVTPETPVTPGTPEVLPATGPAAIIGGLFGSSALGLGVTSYVRSRHALRDALNN